MVTDVASSVTSKRGLNARLRYLTRSQTGYEAMARAGITATPRTIKLWIAWKQKPNNANRDMLDAAYWVLHRHNAVTERS